MEKELRNTNTYYIHKIYEFRHLSLQNYYCQLTVNYYKGEDIIISVLETIWGKVG